MRANHDFLYISTSAIRTKDIVEAVNQLSGITKNIELSGGCAYDKDLLKKLIELKQQKDINFLVHGYFPPPQEHFVLNFADTDRKTREFIRETINYVKCLDVSYYSIHAGFRKVFTFDADRELLYEESNNKKVFVLENIADNIRWFIEEFPYKKIAIENLYPNNNDKECGFLMHINEIVMMLENFTKIYLLLDLGHLKVSSNLLGFNYLNAVNLIFENYGDRVIEIHLSENDALHDKHFLVQSNSIQYMVLKRYAKMIHKNKINITIESRNSSIKDISKCYNLINNAIN